MSEQWAQTPSGTDDAALIIAIERYDQLPKIRGVERTGKDWASFFRNHRSVPLGRVKLLSNANATRESIQEEVESLAERVGPNGTLWVVFLGHGAPTTDRTDGYLLGSDARKTVRSIDARGVRKSELEQWAATAPNTILVLDACFSGEADSGPLVEDLMPVLPNSLTQGRATVVLAAGAGNQYAGPMPNLRPKRPAFSYLMLGALRGWGDTDRDGRVTAREAVDFATTALAGLTDRTQTPQVVGQEGWVMSTQAHERLDLVPILTHDSTARRPRVALRVAGATMTAIGAGLVMGTALVSQDMADGSPGSTPLVIANTVGWGLAGAGGVMIGASFVLPKTRQPRTAVVGVNFRW